MKLLLIPIMLWGTTDVLKATDYSLDFNSNSQYVDCGNLGITGSASRTVEAWIDCNTFNDGGAFQMGTPGVDHGEFTLRTGSVDNLWVVQIWNNDINFSVTSKNIWTHFALSYDGTNIKVYVNGVLITTQARSLTTASADFYIGRWVDNFFDGQIDEIQVYDDVRTEAEIRKDMVEVNTSDANLLAYYKMTNGSGTALTDNDGSGTAFPGTLAGGVTWVTDVYDTYPSGSGTSGTPYQLQNIRDLYWLSQHSAEWDKVYIQTANINASATTGWGSGYNAGFSMIGTSSAGFTGSYDGNNHEVSNLYCKHNDPGYGVPGERVGFFGNLSTATISNLGLTNVYVDGYKYVGGLVGQSHTSTISNCYSTGTVITSGNYSGISGGLIGINISSTLNSSYSECTTSGIENYVGGLVGSNSSSNINNCYSTGSVTGQGSYCAYTGGLIGRNEGTSNVYQSYSTGNVNSADDKVGGLVGSNSAEVNDCYSTGNVIASNGIGVGGLIGENSGTINNSYARGSTTGSQQVGGLVGYNSSAISKSFSTGAVNNAYNSGGLVGLGSGSVSQCFWDTETSGKSSSASGTGKTTSQMNIRTTFSDAGWDFRDAGAEDLWNIGNNRNNGYPYLDWQYPADPVVSMASLTTSAISDISTTSASSGGDISSDGGGSVVARGVCWSTSTTPTISHDQTSDGTGTGSFSSSLDGLSTSTTYYVRAYANNPAGTAYGNQQQFTTWDELPAFSASPTSHTFGSLLVGETAQQTITVSNTGGGFLNITAVTPPAAAYTVSPSSASIAGSASQVFTLTFTPITAGDQNGNLAFSDNAGNHTVAITGAGLFQAQSDAGNMLTLNGISQYLEAELVSTTTDNVTMEAWVNWEGQSSGSAGIMYNGNSGVDGYGIMLYDGVGRNLTILCGGVAFLTSSTALPINSWHHVAAVRASGTWKLYLDGVERSITAETTTPGTPNGKLNIGSVTVGTSQFKGKLDEVRFWEIARSQAQIRDSYGSLAGNETGLTAYYRLDEGNGTSTGDGTGHEYSATLYNTPTWGSSSAPVSDPVFSATPSSHAFGDVLMGESAQQTITVTNSGGGILHISSIGTPGDDFVVSPTSVNIAEGNDQDFTVTFTPSSTTAQSGNLAFTSNLGTSNIAVSGTGVFAAQADAETSLSFTGNSSQYLVISEPSNPTAYTVEMWVKPSGGVNQNIFVRTASSNPLGTYSQQLYINETGHFIHYIWDGSGRYVTGSTIAQENTWYHVAITGINNGLMRLYINGLEEGTATSFGTMQASLNQYRIGSSSRSGSVDYFTGEIDEVRLWNDVRTQTELQANYGSLAGNETGLIGYWRFDEGSGSTTGDGSGNERTATLYNSPTWGSSTAPVVDPVFSASPSSHAFGNVLMGESAQQTITLTNSGGGILHVTSIATPGNDFVVSPSSTNIASGDNQEFTVTFTPTSTNAQNGNLAFTNNLGTSNVALSGTGVFTPQADAENTLTFDGINQYLEAPVVSTATDNITMEAWVNWEGQSGSSGIMYNGNSSSNGYGLYILENEGLTIIVGSIRNMTTNVQLPTNSWHHVAAVRQNGYWALYLDGVLYTPDYNYETPHTPSGEWDIGSFTGAQFPFKGKVDEVRFWDTARSQAQIQASYASLAGNETGLTAYWRLDEGSGSSVCDGTGHGHTASLINSPTWGSSTAPVVDPVFSAAPSSLDLGSVVLGSHSQQDVTITNNGGGILNIASAASDEGQFTVSPTSADIAASANQVFTVTFTPSSRGSTSAILTFTHNPNGTTHTVSLAGEGQQAPTVTTQAVSSIDQTTATGNGNITDLGYPNPTQHGVCWSTSENPTVSDSKTEEGSASTTGAFTSSITGLTANTTYHVRAYATNSAGTSYGVDVSFTTLESPTVTTQAVSSIDQTTVTGNGNITDLGYPNPTQHGVCWSTAENPTVSDSKTEEGSASTTGAFTSSITGLTANTTYHVRAYATNSAGTSYGADQSFHTQPETTEPVLVNGKYQITSLENLYWIAHDNSRWGYDYIQTVDIDASSTADWFPDDSGVSHGWLPIGTSTVMFTGSYDGQEHTIDKLTINRSTMDYVGLFGLIQGSDIQNLGVTNVDISGKSNTGSLIGYNYNYSTVSNCYSTGNISGYYYTGGLVGYNGGSTISNSYSTGNVSGFASIGGLVGSNSGSTTSNSYSTGGVSGSYNTGGLVGSNSGSTISNSYSTGSVSGYSCTGGFIGSNLSSSAISNSYSTGNVSGTSYTGGFIGYNDSIINDCFWDIQTSGTGTGIGAGDYGTAGKTTLEMKTLSTFTDAGWDFKNETTNGDYEVWHIDTGINNGYPSHYNRIIISTTDITEITSTSAFSGGHISDEGNGAISVRGVCWSTAHNPTTADSTTTDSCGIGSYSASITGLTNGQTYYVRAYATNSEYTAYGTEQSFYIQHVVTEPAQVNGKYEIASLENLNWIAEDDSRWGSDYVQTADIDASSTSGRFPDGNGTNLGWLPIGTSATKFTGSYDGQGHTIDGLTVDRSTMDYVGLFGLIQGSDIQNLGVTNVDISGNNYIGGLVGYNYYSSTVSNCYSTGSVSGNNYIGGLMAYNYYLSTVSNCYSTGSVSGNNNIGGLMAYNYYSSTVSNCYSTGNASGEEYIGGLVGYNYYSSTISNCYSTGSATGNSYAGGFAGYSDLTVSDCFWDTQTSGTSTGIGGGTTNGVTGKTTVEMQDYTTFTAAGWDFVSESANGNDDFWDADQAGTVNNGYPILVGQAGADNSLPVELSFFKAESKDGQVKLTWQTESETENLGFIVESRLQGAEIWIELDIFTSNPNLEGQGSTTKAHTYEYLDTKALAGLPHEYRLSDMDYAGKITHHSVLEFLVPEPSPILPPQQFALLQNYPNPFNPSTTIRYELPKTSDVKIIIYDLLGQQAYTFTETSQAAGYYSLQWSGLDQNGAQVASGIYFIVVSTPEFRDVKKMVLNR